MRICGLVLAVCACHEAASGVDAGRDADAAVTIDAPIDAPSVLSLEAYIKASNAAPSDVFGFSLALSGDGSTLAVGAIGEDSAAVGIDGSQNSESAATAGAVYVFRRVGSAWAQEAYVKSSNTQAGGNFGRSVALSDDGSTLAVGELGSGTVYVFTRTGATWAQMSIVQASNHDPTDGFGGAVALSGDGSTLAVGARNEDSPATGIDGNQGGTVFNFNAGAVYVFSRATTTWPQQAYVKASNTGAGDGFGTSLALARDGLTLAVGADQEESAATGIGGNQADNTALDAGAVYVFARAGTTWTQHAYVKASNTGAGDWFGFSVDLSADGAVLAVGAFREDGASTGVGGDEASNAAADSGASYTFVRSGATWVQQAYVKASNTGAGDGFGFDVSLDADATSLAVAAYAEDSAATGIGSVATDDAAVDAGAVYLLMRTGASWAHGVFVKASNTNAGDEFGHKADLSADGLTLAVSADLEQSAARGIGGDQTDNSASNAGAAYVFH